LNQKKTYVFNYRAGELAGRFTAPRELLNGVVNIHGAPRLDNDGNIIFVQKLGNNYELLKIPLARYYPSAASLSTLEPVQLKIDDSAGTRLLGHDVNVWIKDPASMYKIDLSWGMEVSPKNDRAIFLVTEPSMGMLKKNFVLFDLKDKTLSNPRIIFGETDIHNRANCGLVFETNTILLRGVPKALEW
jgi:hypothetical protein